MTGLIILGILLLAGLWAVGVYNGFVAAEQTVKARYKASQASLTNAVNTLKTMGVTTQKYIDVFTNALKIAIEGRYGQGGSKAVVQFLQEQNPTMPTEVMTKLQDATEEVYADFYASNVATVDADRAYMTSVKSFPANLVASIFKFPTFEYTNAGYDKVIMTAESETAFQTSKMESIDPFE